MFLYDSTKKQKLKFDYKGDEICIYLCGPTVYDDAHLGHAKSAINFDILRRALLAQGNSVKFVRNYTDIDDKILKKMSQNNQTLEQITTHYIQSYENDMRALNILEPNFKPKATEFVPQMVDFIKSLLDKDFAYKLDDGIYFDTSKDTKYLTLSSQTSDQTKARVNSNSCKKNDRDFVLWKFDSAWYEADFGCGRPGWHTECVVMIKSIFGSTIDIHAGGIDLLFPHHENEASQCRCAHNAELANFWLHNGFIQIDGEKMSKSLNNSFFVKDALKIAPGEALRFYLLSTHYRANFNYNEIDLYSCKKRLDKLYRLKSRVTQGIFTDEILINFDKNSINELTSQVSNEFLNAVLDALNDDLNTSLALSKIDEMLAYANEKLDKNPKDKNYKREILNNLRFVSIIFGILQDENYFKFGVDDSLKDEIDKLILLRDEAKKQKDFTKADLIRDELKAKGISLMDAPTGTTWEKS